MTVFLLYPPDHPTVVRSTDEMCGIVGLNGLNIPTKPPNKYIRSGIIYII